MDPNEAFPERIVKPRRTGYKPHQIVALRHDTVLTEDGELLDFNQFIESLAVCKPVLVVKQNVADFVALLDERFSDHPHWQWRASSKERDVFLPGRELQAHTISTVIHFFGFQKGAQDSESVFHMALDPVTFYGRSIDKFYTGDEPVIYKLMRWAKDLRQWCQDNNLAVKPTNGGLATQLLRDARFYPDRRRKVPHLINERVREQLPGNYYQLCTDPTPYKEYSAHYLDQKRSHHYHAQHTALPNSNSLFAFGRFLDLANTVSDSVWPDFYGLYFLDLLRPETQTDHPFTIFSTKADEGDREFSAFVYSNELGILADHGFTVTGVRAAWGSKYRDQGIPRYAQWCQQQLDQYNNAAWLKPILLCTYGVLAVRPSEMSFVYKRAKRGEPVSLFAGQRKLHGLLVNYTNGRKLEPAICNVLHRGMIEAATRAESLGLAHYLTYLGRKVLSIYADAVIVETEESAPEAYISNLPEPWRLHRTLNHLRFINTQAFVSGEMSRLPGVTGMEHKRYSRNNKDLPLKTYFDALSGKPLKSHEYDQRGIQRGRI